jgi:signal transduction histidine kinase
MKNEDASLLTEAAASVERWKQSKDLGLDVRVEGTLPKVYADRDKMIQVIINLLSNSIKFTPAGGKIFLEARVYDGPISFDRPHVEVCVKDTGEGIAEERMGTIFEKYKGASADNQLPSTGLGLPICKQIVEIHGGVIWAESRLGKGSSFTFTIPTPPAASPEKKQA